ncbi:MAG: T9SS type A sorting domain-containing protein [Bacteroidales bacterium]|nr:T9SS type A sorting domain-containing protein [Bacteroidales bacterium]
MKNFILFSTATLFFTFLFCITFAQQEDILWSEDFEDYLVGSYPSPNWSHTGSGDIYVINTTSCSGEQSLRFHGNPGGNYESIPCRLLEASTLDGFVLEFCIYISSDHIQGVHPYTGGAGLKTECSWTTGQGVLIIDFWYDGTIGSRIGNLGMYDFDTWYDIRMDYYREDENNITLSYWINGEFKDSQSVQTSDFENDLAYFHGYSGDGTVLLDNIIIESLSTIIKEDSFHNTDISIYPNPFEQKSTIEFTNPAHSNYKLSVFNISGNKVFEMDNIKSDKIEFKRGNLPKGVYLIELKGEKVFRGKMVVR